MDRLMGWGYDTSALKGTIIPIKKQKIITEEHLIEHQKYLMHVVSAGKKFTVMSGNHLSSDDIFIAAGMSLLENEKQHLEVLKKKCEQLSFIEAQGKSVIEKGHKCN